MTRERSSRQTKYKNVYVVSHGFSTEDNLVALFECSIGKNLTSGKNLEIHLHCIQVQTLTTLVFKF